jgi:type IV pilus assembly protein PilE
MCPDAAEAGARAVHPGPAWRWRGFTLIEVMIVVAVVAILAAIALPSYQESVRKARRTDARAALTTIAQRLERWNTERNTYVGAPLGALVTENDHYDLSLTTPTASTFTITATPKGAQAADACGTYQLDQAGTRTPSAQGCW